jgi:hypothetical protein
LIDAYRISPQPFSLVFSAKMLQSRVKVGENMEGCTIAPNGSPGFRVTPAIRESDKWRGLYKNEMLYVALNFFRKSSRKKLDKADYFFVAFARERLVSKGIHPRDVLGLMDSQ